MKNLHHHFIYHLRSYRTFHFLFFTFILLLTSIAIYFLGNKSYAKEDLLEQAFKPAMQQETVINLGAGKNAVGNEVLREGVNVQDDLGQGCFINNGSTKVDGQEVKKMICESLYDGVWNTKNGQLFSNECVLPDNSIINIENSQKEDFCVNVLGGDRDTTVLQTEAPLIVRIAKFFLRITMVLAVTMVIFNGIMRIIESSKGAEVKDAKKNITLIVAGILIALASLGIINLISSLTVSSLSGFRGSSSVETTNTVDDNVVNQPRN